jgi:hypothetical protein
LVKCLIFSFDIPLAIWAEALPGLAFTFPFLTARAMRAAVACFSDLAGIFFKCRVSVVVVGLIEDSLKRATVFLNYLIGR